MALEPLVDDIGVEQSEARRDGQVRIDHADRAGLVDLLVLVAVPTMVSGLVLDLLKQPVALSTRACQQVHRSLLPAETRPPLTSEAPSWASGSIARPWYSAKRLARLPI